MNDHIFQQLAANYPEHMVWEINLRNMWAAVDENLQGAVMTFTASNGYEVDFVDGEQVRTRAGQGSESGGHVDALREFFQHERDEELGRWRSAEYPDFVAYFNRILGYLTVTWEPQGGSTQFCRDDVPESPLGGRPADVARAYFEAHPEPKPWHDATDGHLWILRFTDYPATDVSALVKGGKFIYNDHCHEGATDLTDSTILFGRKIWPEES